MNHSPLPWKAEPDVVEPRWVITTDTTHIAATLSNDEGNADYIVRACNNFEALLEACQAYLAHESQTFTGTPREKLEKYNQAMRQRQEGDIRRQIREAVAAATPEPEPKT